MSERRGRYVVARSPANGRALLLSGIPEQDWEREVEALLTLHGWSFIHLTDARRQRATGWPDLFATKGSRALALELKTTRGRLHPLQREWLDRLREAGIETHVLRPADRPALVALLADESAAEGGT